MKLAGFGSERSSSSSSAKTLSNGIDWLSLLTVLTPTELRLNCVLAKVRAWQVRWCSFPHFPWFHHCCFRLLFFICVPLRFYFCSTATITACLWFEPKALTAFHICSGGLWHGTDQERKHETTELCGNWFITLNLKYSRQKSFDEIRPNVSWVAFLIIARVYLIMVLRCEYSTRSAWEWN